MITDHYRGCKCRFKLKQTDSDAWSVGSRSSFGGPGNLQFFKLSFWSFSSLFVIAALFALSIVCHHRFAWYFDINAYSGDINPVDCAKQCLMEGQSNCNSFTFEDGVCTLGNLQSAIQSGQSHWHRVEELWMCCYSPLRKLLADTQANLIPFSKLLPALFSCVFFCVNVSIGCV